MTETGQRVTNLDDVLSPHSAPIAVSFTGFETDAELATSFAFGVDVAELRIDRFASANPDEVRSTLARFVALPLLATIRSSQEGGEWAGSDAERLELFRTVIPHVQGVDIEASSEQILDHVVQAARDAGATVVISSHDFDRTPSAAQLLDIASRAKQCGADLVKLSMMANSTEDVRRLAAFTLEHAGLGLITIAMGDHGSISRVAFPMLGSQLTYAHNGTWAAPGQLDHATTVELLDRFYPGRSNRRPSS